MVIELDLKNSHISAVRHVVDLKGLYQINHDGTCQPIQDRCLVSINAHTLQHLFTEFRLMKASEFFIAAFKSDNPLFFRVKQYTVGELLTLFRDPKDIVKLRKYLVDNS